MKEDNKLLNKLLEYGVVFYKEFILPNKKYQTHLTKKKLVLKIIEVLKTSSTDDEPEEIQTKIYEIGCL